MGGPIRAGCLGEEAEKTGKGTGRERIWHSLSLYILSAVEQTQ